MAIGSQILFALLFTLGVGLFVRNMIRLRQTIFLGRRAEVGDQPKKRWQQMMRVALGQSKMGARWVPALLHLVVYVGFVIINIEVLEIVLDGFLGTHRLFAQMPGYGFLINTFEVLALAVVIAVGLFWVRRNLLHVKRLAHGELNGWPKMDANLILYIEWFLMGLFLLMNAADSQLQVLGAAHYPAVGPWAISSKIQPLMADWSVSTLVAVERIAWWLHIAGILFFLNYLYYSKHLHILLAFPNTYYAKISALGGLSNNADVQREVALMMDPSAVVPASDSGVPPSFGAKDVTDLSWNYLLQAYSCTECGRCTSECPAHQTGKKLSPRRVVMQTRDRAQEIAQQNKDLTGELDLSGALLLHDRITPEELWACTTCNACTDACPIGIDPLSIIMEMRRYLVMEESSAPLELNNMMGTIENNGAPWPFSQMDRAQWIQK
ncbi:MAG: (Fe-S)-binding protein [Flavobacteriaceae bacterium]|nr:(Fe-S)-binding protein [Flavobacteriaceae bacterium]